MYNCFATWTKSTLKAIAGSKQHESAALLGLVEEARCLPSAFIDNVMAACTLAYRVTADDVRAQIGVWARNIVKHVHAVTQGKY